MAKFLRHWKGFDIVQLSSFEAKLLGFGTKDGCICMECGNIIKDSVYYIPVLNDTMDLDCLKNYLSGAKYFEEDMAYERKHLKDISKRIGLDLSVVQVLDWPITVSQVEGCVADSLNIDGIEEIDLNNTQREYICHRVALWIQRHPQHLNEILNELASRFGEYECLSEKPCECCGDIVTKNTLVI